MATNWDQYGNAPQGFSTAQRQRVAKIKGALKRGAGGASKRLRGEMKGLYGERKARMAPYDQGSYGEGTLTGRQIDQQVIGATRGKFGQAFGQLETNIGKTDARQAQLSKYYDDYNADVAALRTQASEAAQSMIDTQAANTKSTQASEQSANTATATAMQSDAAARGQSVDTAQFAKANQASAARATTGNSQSAALMSSKNAYDNYYGQQGLAGTKAKGAAMQQESQFTQTLRDQLLGLQQDAGDFATTTRGSLDEAQYNRALSAQALGIKATSAKTATASAKSLVRDRKQDNALAGMKFKSAEEKDAYQRANKLGPYKPAAKGKGKSSGLTPAQKRKAAKDWRNLNGYVDDNYSGYKGTAKDLAGTLKNGYDDGKGTKLKGQTKDDFMAKAAATRKRYNGVTSYQSRILARDYGIKAKVSPAADKAAHPKKSK